MLIQDLIEMFKMPSLNRVVNWRTLIFLYFRASPASGAAWLLRTGASARLWSTSWSTSTSSRSWRPSRTSTRTPKRPSTTSSASWPAGPAQRRAQRLWLIHMVRKYFLNWISLSEFNDKLSWTFSKSKLICFGLLKILRWTWKLITEMSIKLGTHVL